MAVYSASFDAYTTGVQPSDWTLRWTTTDQTWAVREKAGDTLGKSLEHTRTTTARRLISWDAIDADGGNDDSEILLRWRSSAASNTDQFSLVLRGSGAAGSEQAYIFHNSSGTNVRVSKIVAGTITALANFAFDLTSNEWHSMRFRINGTDIKAKIWSSEHQGEPAGWNIEFTDASIAGTGWVGIGNSASTGTRDHDDIAVGTSGDAAVFPVADQIRATRASILALTTAPGEARVTRSAVLVLGELIESSPLRVTRTNALALVEFEAGLRITRNAVLVLADQVNCLTKWTQTWTITRTDGQIFGFTAHDMPINFRGVVHQPCNSFLASAAELSTILGSSGNMELSGILSDLGISERDLYNGLFDDAIIESWMVPWDNSGPEVPFRIMGGVVGQANFGETSFKQEVLSDGARLQQKALLETYTASCRYKFGNQNDPRCPVDLVSLTVAGSVTNTAIPNATTSSLRRVFVDSSRAEADGFFDMGSITWQTGANAGAMSEIKSFVGNQFFLWDTLLNPIAIGDTYTATPGCDKSTADHLVFNANLIDFGGFPDIPGNDDILKSPDAKG